MSKRQLVERWLSAKYYDAINDPSFIVNAQDGCSISNGPISIKDSESTSSNDDESFNSCRESIYSWSPKDENRFKLKFPWKFVRSKARVNPDKKPPILKISTQFITPIDTGKLNDINAKHKFIPGIDSVLGSNE